MPKQKQIKLLKHMAGWYLVKCLFVYRGKSSCVIAEWLHFFLFLHSGRCAQRVNTVQVASSAPDPSSALGFLVPSCILRLPVDLSNIFVLLETPKPYWPRFRGIRMNSHRQLAKEFPSSAGAVQARLQSVLVAPFTCARTDKYWSV